MQRAAKHRQEMGNLRVSERGTPLFNVLREARGSTIVLEASYEAVLDYAIIFGDWLFNARAAFDYLFYQLAVEDTGQNPPTRPRARTFPVCRSLDQFEQLRGGDVLHGLSPHTVNAVESMQPYHTSYGAQGNGLLWLHDLARKDRHRQPFQMGCLITEFQAHVQEAAAPWIIDHSVVDPTTTPMVVGSGEKLVLAKFRCRSSRDAAAVAGSIAVDVTQTLEVVDWFRETHTQGVSSNIRNDGLEERMKFIEQYHRRVVDHFERNVRNGEDD